MKRLDGGHIYLEIRNKNSGYQYCCNGHYIS
jgi:hypothetical protein